MDRQNPEISVIIVTYNSEKYIVRCLESIYQYGNTPFECIVVDNASTDKSVELAESLNYDHLKIVRNPKNLGYSAACNIGFGHANGKIICFCNPDIILMNDIFNQVSSWLDDETIGCVSPQIYNQDGCEIQTMYAYPRSFFCFIREFMIWWMNRGDIKNRNGTSRDPIVECDWLVGACIFIPAKVFREVQGFDQDFFLYHEDTDLCKRISRSGYRIILNRNIKIVHIKYGSSHHISKFEYSKIRLKSILLYTVKHDLIKSKWTSGLIRKMIQKI